MMGLKDHTAIVTGGGSGLGQAMATRLASEGIPVTVADLNLDTAQATVDTIVAAGGRASAVAGDVSKQDNVKAIFAHGVKTYGDCTLLCNNAGHAEQKPFLEITVEDFDRMLGVHMRGMFMCAQAALPPMLEKGDGVIINVASQLGHLGAAGMVHYASAKAGIAGMTRSMAREFSRTGVRIFAVAPGATRTPIFDTISDEWLAAKAAELPLGRFAEPEEVSETVAFLASPLAAAFVGQTMNPNCGDYMA